MAFSKDTVSLNSLVGKKFIMIDDIYGAGVRKGTAVTFDPINWRDGIVYLFQYDGHGYITYISVGDFVKSTVCVDLLEGKDLFIYFLIPKRKPPEFTRGMNFRYFA